MRAPKFSPNQRRGGVTPDAATVRASIEQARKLEAQEAALEELRHRVLVISPGGFTWTRHRAVAPFPPAICEDLTVPLACGTTADLRECNVDRGLCKPRVCRVCYPGR